MEPYGASSELSNFIVPYSDDKRRTKAQYRILPLGQPSQVTGPQ
jgi:hypothetical protein